MMTAKTTVILALMAGLIGPGHAWSADAAGSDPGSVTLRTLVARAVDRAPDAALFDAYMAESHALDRRAGSWFGEAPSASVSAYSDQPTDGDGMREYEVGVEWPLPRIGESDAWSTLSGAAQAQARAHFEALQWRLAGEVREAVWVWALAQSELEQARLLRESAGRLEADVSRRVEAGDLSDGDLLLARQEAAARAADVEQARRSVSDAGAALKTLTGDAQLPSKPREPRSPRESVPPDHPRLRLAAAEVERAQRERSVTRIQGAGKAALSLGVRRDRGARGEDFGNAVGLGLTVPFGTGSHQAPELAQAERVYTEAHVRQQQAMRELERSRRESAERLVTLDRELQHAEQSLEFAESYYQLQRRAFDLGEVDLLELIRARERVAEARTLHDRKRLERNREVARYNQAVGDMPDET